MDRLKEYTPFALFFAWCIALGGFLFGYHTAVIAGALSFISHEFTLAVWQEGLAVSIILIGALIGSVCAGMLADTFGRRRIVLATGILSIVGTIIQIAAPSFFVFIFGRFFTGISIGIISLVVPLYLAEIAPTAKRGSFVALNQLAITIGILGAYIVGFWFAKQSEWRPMIGFAILPAAIQYIAMLFFPESPRWLIAHKHPEKAYAIFDKLSKNPKKRSATEINSIGETNTQSMIPWRLLFRSPFIQPLIIGTILSIFQQITGINAVIYYAPKILQQAGYGSVSSALFASIAIGCINVLATPLSAWLLDRVGRKPLLLIGSAFMTLSLGVLSFAFLYDSPWVHLLSISSLVLYVGCFALSLGPVTWVVLAELYPLHMRGKAMSVAIFANWLFNYVVSFTFLDLMRGLGSAGIFFLYAVMGILAFIFAYRYIPETMGKNLDT